MMTLRESQLGDLPLMSKGKVRDIYDMGDKLLLVTTDRISAFDVIFDASIPDKGRVLNGLSAFWFKKLEPICPNHLISAQFSEFPAELRPYADQLEGRSMLAKKARMLPVECIVRGYLEGSALKEYRRGGTVAGIKLPEGLRQGDALPEAIFTPSTKEESGHDVNIDYPALVHLVGEDSARALRERSLALYTAARDYAAERGLLLADSKFEFGWIDGTLCVCDELLTPDSSRFWAAEDYEPGNAQKSFDKQFLREYLETLDWNKQYPAPPLPEEVIEKTAAKYREAYRLLTGETL